MKNLFKGIKNQFVKLKTGCKKYGEKIAAPFKKIGQTKAMQFLGKCMKPIVKIPFVGYLLLACALNLLLEVLSRHSLIKALAFIAESPTVFLYNAFIIFAFAYCEDIHSLSLSGMPSNVDTFEPYNQYSLLFC